MNIWLRILISQSFLIVTGIFLGLTLFLLSSYVLMGGACIGLFKNVDLFVIISSKAVCLCWSSWISDDITHKCLTCSSFHTISTFIRFCPFSYACSLEFVFILIIWLNIVAEFENIFGHFITIDSFFFLISFELSVTM